MQRDLKQQTQLKNMKGLVKRTLVSLGGFDLNDI